MVKAASHDFVRVDDLRFYSLSELEKIMSWPSGGLLRSAISQQPYLKFCILVPPKYTVFTIDKSSVDFGLHERMESKRKADYVKPSEFENPQLEIRGKVLALGVDMDDLKNIGNNWQNIERNIFSNAYILDDRVVMKYIRVIYPSRAYFDGTPQEVMFNSDLIRARFSVYSKNVNFKYNDVAGYNSPEYLDVNLASLSVLGSEFKKWFRGVGYSFLWNRVVDFLPENEDLKINSAKVIRDKSTSSGRMNLFREVLLRVFKRIGKPIDEISLDDVFGFFENMARHGEDVKFHSEDFKVMRMSLPGDKYVDIDRKMLRERLERLQSGIRNGVIKVDDYIQ